MTRPVTSRGMYCAPIPTAMASSTEPDTSGDGMPQRDGSAMPVMHVPRVRDRLGAEEDPREAHDLEDDDALDAAPQHRVGGIREAALGARLRGASARS